MNRLQCRSAGARARQLANVAAKDAANPWYEVTLIEGKNRQIRRMFEEIGHHVEKIKRVKYGPLELDVVPGEYRRLEPEEVRKLQAAAANPRRTANESVVGN